MRPQKQKFRHRPDLGEVGDCHRTALACLLELDRDQVPHFGQTTMDDPAEFNRLFDQWLLEQGYRQVRVLFLGSAGLQPILEHQGALNPTAYYLLGGQSRTGVNHTVIGHGGRIVWDPSVDDAGIVGPLDDGHFEITFLTPAHLHEVTHHDDTARA